MSPTSPMMVRVTPLLTNAAPPTLATRSTTCVTSASVAPAAITMTTRAPCHTDGSAVSGAMSRETMPDEPLSDRQVGDLALELAPRRQLDQQHRGEHEGATQQHAGGERLATEEDGEERGEDGLHAHHDGGAGGREVCLGPGLADDREGAGDQRH